MKAGGITRRCGCRDEDGKLLGTRCPKLRQRNHGWRQIRQELPPTRDGRRRTFRRSAGYGTDAEAQADLDKVRALLRIAEDDDDADQVAELLMSLRARDPIPEPEDVRHRLRTGRPAQSRITVGEWLQQWLEQETHRPATEVFYAGNVRRYLVPLIGEVPLAKLQVAHLVKMFREIDERNDAIEAANADRRAVERSLRQASTRAEKRRLRAQLAELPPYRRTVGPTTKARIRATLRAALNDAIRQRLASFNAAAHLELPAPRPRPIVWTPERVAEWRRTGQRPGPVMVWTPEQAGEFLDHVEDDPLYALWHLVVHRGLRRGELCGLRETDVRLGDGVIEVSTQLTEVDSTVIEGDPKSFAGSRVVSLDRGTVDVLRTYQRWKRERRLAAGPEWVESGRFFVTESGGALRPSWVTDRWSALVADAGLPPIRLHDARHVAATLALAAGVPLKVVQETLGHAALSTTADLYTSVLPEVSREAAEATAALVPRRARREGA